MILQTKRFAAAALWSALLLLAAVSVRAQPATPTLTAAALEQRIVAARTELVATLETARRAAKANESDEIAQREVGLWQQLDLTYAEQLAAIKWGRDLATARAEISASMERMQRQGLEEKPPYSLLVLDAVQDDLDGAHEEAELAAAAVRTADEALQQARDQAVEREQARRAARETLETSAGTPQSVELQTALRLAQLESRLANERVVLRELALRNEQLAKATHDDRVAMLLAKVNLLQADACLRRPELDTQLEALAREEEELQRTLTSSRRDLETADRRLMQAQQRLAQQETPEVSTQAEVNARRRARETLQLEVGTVTQRLQRIGQLREVWQQRYEISEKNPSRAELTQWLRDAEAGLAQLSREERLQRGRLAQLRQAAKALNEDIVARVGNAPDVAKWLIEEQERLQDQSALYDAELTSLETARRIHEKLISQIERRTQTHNWRDRVIALRDAAQRVWAFELTAVDDRPITVGKVFSGVVLFLIGLWIARTVSRILGRRILPRLGLDAHASAALQSITFYILLSLLTLFALNVAKVPLTVFTFVGGALAIGIGFGSQNIVNNFISGLILLAERPIKVGDLIEVDGTRGSVERIGPRSTRIRLSNNVDILVPNSAFLEKNVVNWTLTDNMVRTAIKVGVAYGSSTELVRTLLLEATADHNSILRQPPPSVLFTEFGDNALQFELQFWLRVRSDSDRRNAESDVRFRIDRLFRDKAVSIAFPQLDVHLASSGPLPVQVVNGDAAAKGVTAREVGARGE